MVGAVEVPFVDDPAIWQMAIGGRTSSGLARYRCAALFGAIDRGGVGHANGIGFFCGHAGGHQDHHGKKDTFHADNLSSNGYFVRFSYPVSVIKT